MIYVGIMAAGMGIRMHRQDMPKQFLLLGKKPIIIHTLEQFFVNARVEKIIIVVPNTWKRYAEDLIAQYNSMDKEVYVIVGGVNKTESISLLVTHIDEKWGVRDNDILLVHDAIRPFVTQRIINENINAAMLYGAATTSMTTNDTILTSFDGKTVSDVPPKGIMLAQQTPQTYRMHLLKNMLQQAVAKNIYLNEQTELSRLYIQYGNTMHLVPGEYYNMKIINSYDLEVANALLQEGIRD